MNELPPLPRSPRDALELLIRELDTLYYPWYERSTENLKRASLPLQTFALLSGFATAILAAVFTGGTDPIPNWVRVLLITLPAVGSSLSAFIVQAKLFERYQLRENGRLAMQSFLNEARQKFACLKTDDEIVAFLNELRKRVDEVEAKQSDSFFNLMASAPANERSTK